MAKKRGRHSSFFKGDPKKAQYVGTIIFAILTILITTTGFFIVLERGDHIYVGDTRTGLAYDYKSCRTTINEIPEGNQIVLTSIEEMKMNNFNLSERCTP